MKYKAIIGQVHLTPEHVVSGVLTGIDLSADGKEQPYLFVEGLRMVLRF